MPTPPQPGVLVVDEAPATRALLKAYLQQCGFAVYVAEDGAKAPAFWLCASKRCRSIRNDWSGHSQHATELLPCR